MTRSVSLVRHIGVLAFRVVLLVLALRVSGVADAIEDVVGACELVGCSDSDCPCGPADCPPDCSACHGHGAPALPRRLETVRTEIALSPNGEATPAADASEPPSPPLAGPFRPPQTA